MGFILDSCQQLIAEVLRFGFLQKNLFIFETSVFKDCSSITCLLHLCLYMYISKLLFCLLMIFFLFHYGILAKTNAEKFMLFSVKRINLSKSDYAQ